MFSNGTSKFSSGSTYNYWIFWDKANPSSSTRLRGYIYKSFSEFDDFPRLLNPNACTCKGRFSSDRYLGYCPYIYLFCVINPIDNPKFNSNSYSYYPLAESIVLLNLPELLPLELSNSKSDPFVY